jgi:hypothetical protein
MYLIDRKKGKPATIRLFGDQPSVQTEIFGITGSPHWRYIEVEVNPAGFFNRRRGVGAGELRLEVGGLARGVSDPEVDAIRQARRTTDPLCRTVSVAPRAVAGIDRDHDAMTRATSDGKAIP